MSITLRDCYAFGQIGKASPKKTKKFELIKIPFLRSLYFF